MWTNECERALADPENSRTALKLLKKKWVSYLNKLTGVTRSKLSKIDRLKVNPPRKPLWLKISALQLCQVRLVSSGN